MKIPNNFEIVSDSNSFEEWLKRKDTNEVLCEIQHEVDVHYGLYFKDFSGSFPSYYAHPLLKIIYSYYLDLKKTMNFPKQFYKHYKGGIYEVISFNVSIVNNLPSTLYLDEYYCQAKFEHNLEQAFVYSIGDSYQVPSLNSELYSTAFVLYRSVKDDTQYWLRPFNNFMGAIEPFTDKCILRFRRLHEHELLENGCIE